MIGRFVLVVLGGLLAIPGVALAQGACTHLTATGHPEYPPVGYRDGTAIAGAGAALVQEIAARLGVAITVTDTGTWEGAVEAVRTGAADLIFGLYRTDDRLLFLTFVEPPFLLDTAVIMVRAGGGFVFAGQNDLIGKRGVSNIADSWGAAFDAFIAQNLSVARVEGARAVFDALLSGAADYAIVGLYPALAHAAEFGVRDQVTMLTPPISAEPLFVAFSNLSPCLALVERFAAEIAVAIADHHMDALVAAADADWAAKHLPANPAP